MMSKYEDPAQEFLTAYPIAAVVYGNELVDWVEQRPNGHALKSDLLVDDIDKKISAIRRHINQGAGSRNVAENRRFYLEVEDARRKTYVVRSLVDHAQAQADAAFGRSVSGAINPLRASERVLKDIKREELDDEGRRALEAQLHDLVETAAPLKKLLGEQLQNKWVKRLVAKGYSPEQAITLIEVLPTLQQEMRLIRATT
ncbi:hypothetical protein [Bradyrhizobium sp. RT4b]|uniref:hypothetical protein n=1 Tax=unclassified Bradyrhizobium TaxID=2631580 RepID=UPI003399FEE8